MSRGNKFVLKRMYTIDKNFSANFRVKQAPEVSFCVNNRLSGLSSERDEWNSQLFLRTKLNISSHFELMCGMLKFLSITLNVISNSCSPRLIFYFAALLLYLLFQFWTVKDGILVTWTQNSDCSWSTSSVKSMKFSHSKII